LENGSFRFLKYIEIKSVKVIYMVKNFKIGIVGVGVVGGAVKNYFEKRGFKLLLYDKGKKMGAMNEVNKADIVFICVPTPYLEGKGFDLSCVKETCNGLLGKKIVVIKSTVIPGTTEKLQKEYPQHKFLFNPEFLRELTSKQDMEYPDRQIIGYTKKSRSITGDILQILPSAPYKKIMLAGEAEMVKYFGNTWLSTKVIFANQIYDLCKKMKINYDNIAEATTADPRIGKSHLEIFHGGYRGYGGKCFPKDMRALIEFADKQGVDFKLHKIVEEINNQLMRAQNIKDPEKFQKNIKK
jgi:UDPglucose 6-dehydrogenase